MVDSDGYESHMLFSEKKTCMDSRVCLEFRVGHNLMVNSWGWYTYSWSKVFVAKANPDVEQENIETPAINEHHPVAISINNLNHGHVVNLNSGLFVLSDTS